MRQGVLFLLIILSGSLSLRSQGISLQLSGDAETGYAVAIAYGNREVATNDAQGEFDLVIENADRSTTDTIYHWKASAVREYRDGILLSGQVYLENLMTLISIEADYTIVNDHVIRKEIRLEQNNIPLLFYQLENTLRPGDDDVSYWSFDHLDHQGGSIREIYPAAGYMLEDSIAVGLLTDAGYKNQWTRNIRKRPADQRTSNTGFKAVQTIADVNLYRIATMEDRQRGDHFVRLTFGELSDYNTGIPTVLNNSFLADALPHKGGAMADALPHKEGAMAEDLPHKGGAMAEDLLHKGGAIKRLGGADFIVAADPRKPDTNSGIRIPFSSADGFYTIRFKYRSEQPFNLRLLKTRNQAEEVIGFHYKTGIPASPVEWRTFEESALLQGLEGTKAQLLIEGTSDITIHDFEITRVAPGRRPYHRIPLGEKQVKTMFVFATESQDLRDIRLASQVHLAEGMGFKGTDVEKVLFADFMMLTWITGPEDFSPHNVPSINYAPDMYNRDAFWSVVSVKDKQLNESIWKKWGGTQDHLGAIGTIITPYMGSIEKKGNEATCQWIWWGLVNKRRYNSSLDTLRLAKALAYCMQEFDPDGDGIVSSQFSLSQNDVVYFEEKTSSLAVNQGVYAVTLMAARELGFDIAQEYIDKTVEEYRNFYDAQRGYIVSDKDFPYVVSFTDLMPEFVSWWLWDTPLLDSAMVVNTLNKFPVINDCSPIIFHIADTFFTEANKPFLPEQMWPRGQYYNGGSWMRNEICAYVVGMKHGWAPANERIEKRMLAEINLNHDEPFSHEIIPMDLSQPGCWWPSARVFSWNVFTHIALEVAGMRDP